MQADTGEKLQTEVECLRAKVRELEERLALSQLDANTGTASGVFAGESELRQAEANLKQQWHTFDTALSHTPDFTYIFDLDQRFTYVNRALLSLWQIPLEQAVGKNFIELNYPIELAERLQRQIREVIGTRRLVRDHTPFTGPDGETRHYEYIFVPVFGPHGDVEAVAGSTRDITERDRIEKALASSEEKLRQLFAQAPVAIIAFRGREFIVELANPPYQALLQGRELAGRPFADVVPELGQDVWDALNRVLDTGEPYSAIEWNIPYDYDQDGIAEDHWFNVAYNPLLELGGEVSGILAVLTDVTKQVLARRELERVNRELEEFAYVSSHDLQEPLRMVNIYTHLIIKNLGREDPALSQYAGFVREGVAHMEALIKDLLTYSRTVQTREVGVERADLAASLKDALSFLGPLIAESGAVIEVEPLPTVRGDKAQMLQVFQNILSNALKYRKKDVAPEIHISAELNGDRWIVSVRDNGIGFEQRHAERIFGLFKRLHNEEYPGTGLGLAICQRIVERYGGRMWAEGRPGEGATFHCSLLRVEDLIC